MVESKKIRGNGESFFISKEVKLRVPGSRTCPQLKFYSFCNKLSGTTGKKSVPASVPQQTQPDLSSLQVCLCRTPLSYEPGQNQKETSLSPNQHCSPAPLPQDTEQSVPAVCSALGVIRIPRTRLPCNIPGWLRQSWVSAMQGIRRARAEGSKAVDGGAGGTWVSCSALSCPGPPLWESSCIQWGGGDSSPVPHLA